MSVMAYDIQKSRLRIKPVLRCDFVAVCRVACLEWLWWIVDRMERNWPVLFCLCFLKPWLQKRIGDKFGCLGNPLDCLKEAHRGLQCGLSGNQAVR